MTKKILSLLMLLLSIPYVLLQSCNEEDLTPPVITLEGDTIVYWPLNEPYVDPGATATDMPDGDLSSEIVAVIDVNVDKIGMYEIVYRVTDNAGNASAKKYRYVYVINEASNYAGNWNVEEISIYPQTAVDQYSAKIEVDSTMNNYLLIDSLPFLNEDLTFLCEGDVITVPVQNNLLPDSTEQILHGEGTIENDSTMYIYITGRIPGGEVFIRQLNFFK